MKKLIGFFFLMLVGSMGRLTLAHADRWIIYSATQTINCSGFANGGKLTMTGSDAYCSDDVGLSSSGFITNSNSLISGTTFFVSSGTVNGQFRVGGAIIAGSGDNQITTSAGLLDATKLTGAVPNASIDTSSVTKQGNSFNSGSQLLQLSGGLIPNSVVDGSSITKQGVLSVSAPVTLTSGVIGVDKSSVTLLGQSIPASKIAAGSLGSSVIASSIAANGVTSGTYGGATQVSSVTLGVDGRVTGAANVTISLTNTNLQSGTYSNVTVPAANVANGSLGSSVIASSIAASAVQDASIVGVGGAKITGTATIPNAAVDGSSITKVGNTFNGNSQLVQTTSGGALPALSATNLTSIPAANVTGTLNISSGTITNFTATTIVTGGTVRLGGGNDIKGTTSNGNATAGDFGEYISSTVLGANAVTVTNNTYADVALIDLTPGDWTLNVMSRFLSAVSVTGGTQFEGGVGTVSGNSGTGLAAGDTSSQTPTAPTSAADMVMCTAGIRKSLSAETTFYLKAYGAYSGGTLKACGRISARRER